VHGSGNRRKICSYVMFKAIFADVVQQFLHLRDLNNSGTTEGIQWVIGKPSLTDVAAHFAGRVIGGEARESHPLRFDEPHTGAKRVVFTHGSAMIS
jgi:hypothetical protein